ncbi:MAG: diaminopimelate epimerase, partial [Cetobacterium sp.]
YKNIDFAKIIQPGGWLEVSYENNEVFIDGPVEIVAEGISYINL